jgi:hypothetical protein
MGVVLPFLDLWQHHTRYRRLPGFGGFPGDPCDTHVTPTRGPAFLSGIKNKHANDAKCQQRPQGEQEGKGRGRLGEERPQVSPLLVLSLSNNITIYRKYTDADENDHSADVTTRMHQKARHYCELTLRRSDFDYASNHLSDIDFASIGPVASESASPPLSYLQHPSVKHTYTHCPHVRAVSSFQPKNFQFRFHFSIVRLQYLIPPTGHSNSRKTTPQKSPMPRLSTLNPLPNTPSAPQSIMDSDDDVQAVSSGTEKASDGSKELGEPIYKINDMHSQRNFLQSSSRSLGGLRYINSSRRTSPLDTTKNASIIGA